MSFRAKGRSLLNRVGSIEAKIENAIVEISEGRNGNQASIVGEISQLVNDVKNVQSEFKNIVSPLLGEINKSPNATYIGRKSGMFGRAGDFSLVRMPPIMKMDDIIDGLKGAVNNKKEANIKRARNKVAANEAARKAAKEAANKKARDTKINQLKKLNAALKQVRQNIGTNNAPQINSRQLNMIKNALSNENKVRILRNKGYRNVDFNKVRNGTIDANSAKNMVNTLRAGAGKKD
jgi:hypothetical protein